MRFHRLAAPKSPTLKHRTDLEFLAMFGAEELCKRDRAHYFDIATAPELAESAELANLATNSQNAHFGRADWECILRSCTPC